ncbi:hypothetical protein QAD02_009329 [Eretmocerus hayati]|uniref:Uncharacterized protein n=1 Tax=Eretmocerus hayati TaxID=131215 RepID=A0ACC2N9S8_9HYME|nr:hypothetical protein QAD02_009329 [Eretmocerus hayati]
MISTRTCLSRLICGNDKLMRRKIHKYATIVESNNPENVGKKASIQGWVRAVRKMKENVFLDVSDGTSSEHLQVVLKKDSKPESLGYGCSITAEGEISLAPNGRAELHAEKLSVIGECDLDGYPFLPRKQYEQDYIRQYLHLRPRTRAFSSILRLRDIASRAVGDYFKDHNFVNIHTPILTSNDCEGAGEVFLVQPNSKELNKEMMKDGTKDEAAAYFDTKAFLTVSGQLHLEVCARALSRVYNFCPAFRAENSKSRIHLSEFYMIEAEMAFVSSLSELIKETESFIKSVTKRVIEDGQSDLRTLGAPEPNWLDKDFGIITYNEALGILERHKDQLTVPIKHGENLAKEHELFLVEYHEGTPLFVIEWPSQVKPFYMKECSHDASKVEALDLLAPVTGEIIGGSVREDSYSKLESRIPEGLNLNWYLDLRKYGNVPTAGFGMGFERYLQIICGVPNIKDVIPFPRWPHNCSL